MAINFENQKIEKPETTEKLNMFRVKTDQNGDYRLVSDAEYKELREKEEAGLGEHVYESYEFTDVKHEDNGSTTGINNGGERVVIEEKE